MIPHGKTGAAVCSIVLCAVLLGGCGAAHEPVSAPVSAPSSTGETTAATDIPAAADTTAATTQEATQPPTTADKPTAAPKTTKKPTTKKPTAKTTTKKPTTKPSQAKSYGLGDTWVVDGQWELTFDKVERHTFCNRFSDGKGYKEVLIFTYSYKNIGYTGEIQDLYISSFDVYDADGEAADSYPCTHTASPKVCAVGTKCTGAQAAYQVKNAGDFVTVKVDKYRSGPAVKKESAAFRLKIDGAGSGTGGAGTIPADVKTYDRFPYAPDFGAMLGIGCDVVNESNQSNLVSYAYLVSSIQQADKQGESGSDYIRLLTRCGYTDQGTLDVDGVTFYRYRHAPSGTTVQIGVNSRLGAVIVVVFL